MSDTDDTDVLILIPPDYFLVDSSDSENSVDVSLSRSCNNNYQHRVENICVNDLLNQVNDLESRVLVIENKDNFEINPCEQPNKQLATLASSLPSFYYSEPRYLSTLCSKPARFNRSLNDVDYQAKSSTLTAPDSLYPPHSASFADKSIPIDRESEDYSCDSGAVFTEPITVSTSSKSFMEGPSVASKSSNSKNIHYTSSQEMSSHYPGDGAQSNQSQDKTDLIEEIDNFLDSVKKNQQKLKPRFLDSDNYKREKMYKCGDIVDSIPDLNFGVRNLSNLCVREEPVLTKQFASLESKVPLLPFKNRGLSLPEVDKLLEEMESTQLLIEKKLQMKEMQFGKGQIKSSAEQVELSLQPASCGENIGSVPDLGFGVRDLMMSPSISEALSSKNPVNEPLVTKRNISLCGVNPSEQSTNSLANESKSNINDSDPQQLLANSNLDSERSKMFVPRRLELGDDPSTIPDLGFGLRNWYISNDVGLTNVGKITNSKPIIAQETDPQSSNNFIQGGLPASIPDLGFGLQNLWTDTGTSLGTSSSSFHPTSSNNTRKQPQQVSITNSEQLLNSKMDSKRSKLVYHSPNPKFQQNREQTAEPFCAQKVDFSSESVPRDSMILGPDYGSHKSLATPSSSNLPSLSGLWNKQRISRTSYIESDIAPLKHKLEEEKYRRQHCEQIIQQLQISLLEEQQKLAVAVQVDMGKDQAILQFQGAWGRLVGHWKELEEQRHNLGLKRQNEMEHYQKLISEAAQKVKSNELEVSKALDLAQCYKENCEKIEQEKFKLAESSRQKIQELHNKLQTLERDILSVQQQNCNVFKEKEDVMKKMTSLEEETKKDKTMLLSVKKELDKKTKALGNIEADLSALNEEKGTLQLTLREEKSRNTMLEQHKRSLQGALEDSKKKEKLLREEVQNSASHLDKLKIELRDFYQEQVEIVVCDKLREFQGQLDVAEKSLRDELENREQAINDTATKQIRQIMEKHQLEIKLLEEKHKEELQLCQLKLSQATQQIYRLESKMKSHNSRKGELVEQLHDVMETQWQQALRIIHGNSPLSSQVQTKPVFSGMVADHGLLPLPHNSLSQVSNNPGTRGKDEEPKQSQANLIPQRIPSLQLALQSGRSSNADEFSFSKDGQVTYRAADEPASRGQLSELELKKYIEMLLNRSPGNPVPDERSSVSLWQVPSQQGKSEEQQRHKEVKTSDINQLPRWENVDRMDTLSRHKQLNNQLPVTTSIPEFDLSKPSQNSVTGKPPWK